ncbi:DUF4430 domain-containing protein [Haloimpatiens sp. FM7315]|uniref:DUF4430 domain-containing protein n=1 Tax=Haloimpatiens sp. FM7315 TaxID=3298609 RepID=UPI00370BF15F
MNKKIKQFLSAIIIFLMTFTNVNFGFLNTNKVMAQENSNKSTNGENYQNKEETKIQGSTINSVINGVIDYYNEEHFLKNQGQLQNYEYSAMYRAGADLKKKSWYLDEKYQTKYDKEWKCLGTKVNQSTVLLDLEKNPNDFEGRNLINEIAKEVDENTSFFSQIDIKAVITLDEYNMKFKEKTVNYNTQNAVQGVLKAQCEDGGFKERRSSSPINTAYAIKYLSRHKDIKGANEAIVKGVNYLHKLQKEDGGIYEATFITGYSAEVISGLLAAGEDLKSEKWTKASGKNPVDSLFTLWKQNNSFDNKEGESSNNRGWLEATWKAFYTLVDLKKAGYGDYLVKGIDINKYGKGNEEELEEKTCKVNVSIVLPKAEGYDVLIKPKEVVISNKKHKNGFTALGSLEATTSLYELSGKMVTSIFGYENKGQNGWIYSVNGNVPSIMPQDMDVKPGDKIIWYYSMNGISGKVPSWEELTGTIINVEKIDYDKTIRETADKVVEKILKGNLEFDWYALALNKLGKKVPDTMLSSMSKKVKDAKGIFDKETDYEKLVICMLAAGGDPTNVDSYNLVDKIYNSTMSQGLNAYIFGLIALDSGNYEIPKDAKFTRSKIIRYILRAKTEDGGWTYSGFKADVDMTAMAITALAPYYNLREDVKEAIDNAVKLLSKLQTENGGYISWDKENSCSAATVMVALCTLKIDPIKDVRFVKKGKNLVDSLMTFITKDGDGFGYINDKLDDFSTEQVLRAFASYNAFKENSLLYKIDKVNKGKMEVEDITDKKEFKLGSLEKIKVKVTNNSNALKNATLVMALFDENERLIDYVSVKRKLKAGDIVELEGGLKMPQNGKYNVRAFVWEDINELNPLTEVISVPVLK